MSRAAFYSRGVGLGIGFLAAGLIGGGAWPKAPGAVVAGVGIAAALIGAALGALVVRS